MPSGTPTRSPAARAFRRLVWMTTVPAVLLLGSRLVWGWDQQRRFDHEIERIEKRGDPVEAERVRLPPSSAEHDNPAARLEVALMSWPTVEALVDDRPGRAVILDTDWAMYNRGDPDAPPNPIRDDAAYLRDVETAVRHHLDAARTTAPGGYYANLGPTLIGTVLHHLGAQRHLTRLLDDAAERATGLDDAEAVFRYVTDMLVVARRVEIGGAGFLHEAMAADGVRQLAWMRLEAALPALTPPTPEDTARGDAARMMIGMLLADGAFGDRVTDTVAIERLALIEDRHFGLHLYAGNDIQIVAQVRPTQLGHWSVEFTPVEPRLRWWFSPVAYAHFTPVARLHTDAQEALERTELFAERVDALPALSPMRRSAIWLLSGSMINIYRTVGGKWYAGLAAMHARHVAQRRLAAAALAYWCYRGNYGHAPATLGDLVPAFLPAIPEDPFAPAPAVGATPGLIQLHATSPPSSHLYASSWNAFRPPGANPPLPYTGPVLASRGPDLTDDGGTGVSRLIPPGRLGSGFNYTPRWTTPTISPTLPRFGTGDVVFRLDLP